MPNQVHASRFGLLAALLLVTHHLRVSGQSIVASVQPDFALLRTAEHQVKPLAPLVRFGSDARHGNGLPRMLAVAQLSEALTEQARRMARPSDAGWVGQSARRDWARQNRLANSEGSTSLRGQQPGQRQRSWLGRHPVLFGTLVGFGSGFLVAYAGDQPNKGLLFDDADVEANALVLGGLGAGIGALVAAIVK